MMYTHNTQPNDKQILWYEWAANGINELTGKNAEITIFCHIPLPEYQFAYDLAWDSDNKCWHEGYDAYGECNETVACQRDVLGEPYQKGFFNVIKRTETTDFIFCGHDHLNNFSIMYDGVRLSYTLKTGHASGFMLHFNGGTQIQVGSTGINNIKHKTVLWGPVITIENIDV